MEWVLYTLLIPFFASLNNIIDQILVRRYFPENGITAMYLGGVTYLVMLPMIALFCSDLFMPTSIEVIALIALGAISPFIWIPYFKVMERDDASMAMPMFHSSPIFVFLLALVFLGETVSLKEAIGALIIIASAAAISFDPSSKKLKARTLLLMTLCAFLCAIQSIFFRLVAENIDLFTASFWIAVGYMLTDLGFLFFKKEHRDAAWSVVKGTKGGVLIPTSFQEVSYFIAIILTIKALASAPSTALVQTLIGFHAVVVIIMSLIAGYFFKDYFELIKIDKKFAWRMVCGLTMIGGLYLIFN